MITPHPTLLVTAARRLVLALGCVLVLSTANGCVHRAVNISPSLAPVDATRPMVRYKAIQGEVCNPILFYGIPLGDNSLIEALWEMKRLIGVDGYVEVAVEERYIYWVFGYTVCTKVTAYPFTYGDQPKPISVRGTNAARDSGYSQPSGSSGGQAPNTGHSGGAATRGGVGSTYGGSTTYGGGSTSSGTTYRKSPDPAPAPAPAAAPAPAPAPTGPTHAECELSCAAFGKLAGTSELIQRVVAQRCVERCDNGDAGYYQCVNSANAVDDVKRCNSR